MSDICIKCNVNPKKKNSSYCNECYSLYMIEYRKSKKFKESKKKSDKKYYQKNKEKIIQKNQNWKENNLERFYEINKNWNKNNKEKVKQHQKNYRKNNPSYKIRNLFHNLKKRFKNGHYKGEFIIIKNHIESLFSPNMKWELIEIDHKIPITWFKLSTPLILINDLRNLQPLFIKDNREKRNRFCDPISKEYYNLIIQYIKPKRIEQLKIL